MSISFYPDALMHFWNVELAYSRIICMKSAMSETIKFGRFELCAFVSNIRQRQSNIQQKFNRCFKRRIFYAPNTMHKLCWFVLFRQTIFFSVLLWLKCHAQKVKRCVTVHHGVHHVLGVLWLALTISSKNRTRHL